MATKKRGNQKQSNNGIDVQKPNILVIWGDDIGTAASFTIDQAMEAMVSAGTGGGAAKGKTVQQEAKTKKGKTELAGA